jgi:hypothetical protein
MYCLFMPNEPQTLTEAIPYFSDPDVALSTMVESRWPNGVTCPECGRTDIRFIATRRMWECRGAHVRKQFTAKRGTIFEDSPLGLDKWFTEHAQRPTRENYQGTRYGRQGGPHGRASARVRSRSQLVIHRPAVDPPDMKNYHQPGFGRMAFLFSS